MPLICPQCQIPLRIADRSVIAQPFECPECKVLLQLSTSDNSNISKPNETLQEETLSLASPNVPAPASRSKKQPATEAKKKEQSAKKTPPATSKNSLQEDAKLEWIRDSQRPTPPWLKTLNRIVGSPITFLWLMASIITLMIILLVIVPMASSLSLSQKRLQADLDRKLNEKEPPRIKPIVPQKETEKNTSPKDNTPKESAEKNKTETPDKKPPLPAPSPVVPVPPKKTPKKPVENNPEKSTKPKQPPQEPPLPVDPIRLPENLSGKLKQKLVRFTQKKEVPLRHILVELEVLLDVRIDASPENAKAINELIEQTEIRQTFENVTVEQILVRVLKKAGLEYRVGKDRLLIFIAK